MMNIKLRSHGAAAGRRTGRWTRASRRFNLIAFSLAVLALGVGLAPAATFEASYFGFSTNAANNFTAMRALETFSTKNNGFEVDFAPGTYTVLMPQSGQAGYRGYYQGACDMSGVTGVTINAAGAEFYCADISGEGNAMFRFSNCTNVTLRAQFRGEHTGGGDIRDGVKGVHLLSNNDTVTLNLKTTRMFDAVRMGEYLEAKVNHNITVTATNVDSYYSEACFLVNGLTITNWSIGTSSNGFAAHRAVYLNGCQDVIAYSYVRDMGVQDGCNMIGSAPFPVSPYHLGSSNVTLYVTDMGTTNYVQYQSLAKLYIVSSSYQAISIVHKRIKIYLDAPSSATVRTNNYTVAIGSLGTGAAHSFEDVTISGVVGRGPYNTQPTIYVEGNLVGLSNLQVSLAGFHDAVAPSQYTVLCATTVPRVTLTAIDSDVNLVYFGDSSKQTFQSVTRPSSPINFRVLVQD